MKGRSVFGLAVCFSLVFCSLTFGQTTAGTILGTVKDQSGAVLPGATVMATNTDTGIARSEVSGSRGEYRIEALGLGNYEVTATMTGFETANRTGIALTVGREAVVDFSLQVGAVTQQVTVTGEAPLIDTTSATVSGVVEPKQMIDVPLNTRSFLDLTTLQAGVVYAEAGTAEESVNTGFAAKISIGGMRYTGNLFLLDGSDINDAANSSGSVTGAMTGVETVREFKVITNAYDAEYGMHVGGVISAVSKSGTNGFHGSLFEYLRNSDMDAPTWTNDLKNGGAVPPFRRNQFGGSFGGPIKKDTLFFFGSFEGLRQSLTNTNTYAVPGPEMRAGCVPVTGTVVGGAVARTSLNCYGAGGVVNNISATGSGNQPVLFANSSTNPAALGGVVNPSTLPFMNLYPLANSPCIAGCFNSLYTDAGTGNYVVNQADVTSENFWTGRVDDRVSDQDSLFGRYTVDHSSLTTPGTGGSINAENLSTTADNYLTLGETHIFSPTLLSSTSASFIRTFLHSYDQDTTAFPACPTCANPDSFTANDTPGILSITGLAPFGGSSLNPKYYILNSYQFNQTFSYQRGRQALKFGFNFNRQDFNERSDFYSMGDYSFSTPDNFITDNVGTFDTTAPGSNNIAGTRQNIIGMFIQDDIQVQPGLTLNLGLRYEFITVPYAVNGNQATIQNMAPADFYTEKPSQDYVGQPYFINPSLKNFLPRIGLAWSPFKDGKTSIRAGAGMYADELTSEVWSIPMVRMAPFYSVDTLTQGAFQSATGASIAFPNAYQTQIGLLGTGGSLPQADGFEYDPQQPMVYKYSASIQRQLTQDMTLEVGYDGTRGVHNVRGNMNLNTTLGAYIPALADNQFYELTEQPAGIGSNPNWDRMRWRLTDGQSWYNALNVQLTKRYSHGIQVGVAYSWSKSMDDSSSWTGSTDEGGADVLPYRDEDWWGPSSFNVPQSFTTNFTYQMPGANLHGLKGETIGGWNLSGIFRMYSGYPFTPSATDPSLNIFPNGTVTANNGTTTCSTAQKAMGCQTYTVLYGAGSTVNLAPGISSVGINPQSLTQYFNPADFVWPSNFVNNPALLAYPGAGMNGAPGALIEMGDYGRNPLSVPGNINMDATLRKDFPVRKLGEAGQLEFRFEVYNLFNHPRFAAPTSTLFNSLGQPNAAAGTITTQPASSIAREVQLALRLSF